MLSSVAIDGKNVLQLSPLANQGEGGKLPADKNYTFTIQAFSFVAQKKVTTILRSFKLVKR